MRAQVFIGLVLALLAGFWVAFGQQIVGRPMLPLNSANPCVTCTQYTNASNATFAGGNAMQYTNKAIVGISDGKQLTFSAWVKRSSAPSGSTLLGVYNNTSARLTFTINNTGAAQVDGNNSSGTGVVQGQTDNSVFPLGTWTHVLFVVDMTSTNNRHIYINGVDRAVGASKWPIYNNDTIDMVPATPQRSIGNDYPSQVTGLAGSMAEMWFDDSYIDQPCYFYCSGRPATMSSSGQLADGTSNPALYLSRVGSAAAWPNDSSGNGNHFSSSIGSLSSTTSP